jgi:hypothetical protein
MRAGGPQQLAQRPEWHLFPAHCPKVCRKVRPECGKGTQACYLESLVDAHGVPTSADPAILIRWAAKKIWLAMREISQPN